LSHLPSPTGLYDEPKILPYANSSICPMSADVRHPADLDPLDGSLRHLFWNLLDPNAKDPSAW